MNLHIERSGAGRPFVWAHGLTSSIASEREGGLFDWSAVEGIEVIRYDAPIRGLSRLLTADRELSGMTLPAGSRALMLYGSANRDERYWDAPDTFDVTRPNASSHVGFGHGIHGCVGQGLARLEGHALLNALADKVSVIEVGEPEYRVHNTIRAIATLPAALRR